MTDLSMDKILENYVLTVVNCGEYLSKVNCHIAVFPDGMRVSSDINKNSHRLTIYKDGNFKKEKENENNLF